MGVVTNEPATTCDLGAMPVEDEREGAFVAVFRGGSVDVVPLPPGRPIAVGRSRGSEILVDDPAASRLHLTLTWHGGDEVELVDRESRNGTIVDGATVRGRALVRTGTDIRIGATRLLVVVRADGSVERETLSAIDDDDLVAESQAMLEAVAIADRAATSDATVLILGETGVGKEIIARRIHRMSRRSKKPFVVVNCAAIPESLAESILFGHEKGSFTGALRQQRGVFEDAHGGTIFLDEVGELSPTNQARLLRVLEDKTFVRIGSTGSTPTDVRVLAATHRDLRSLAAHGGFRSDLIFRLDVVRIAIPSLRDRPEDVVPIAERLLRTLAPGRSVRLASMARRALLAYEWPGNVRELRNRLESALATGSGDVIQESDLSAILPSVPARGGGPLRGRVEEAETAAILEALQACSGNQTRVADRLGISRRTLVYRLSKYGLQEAAYEARTRGRQTPRPRSPS